MIETMVRVENKTGLHARPAALFVEKTKQFKSDITIEKGCKKANGKSILGILSLGIAKGSDIRISADGEDEIDALANLKTLVESFVE